VRQKWKEKKKWSGEEAPVEITEDGA